MYVFENLKRCRFNEKMRGFAKREEEKEGCNYPLKRRSEVIP